MMVIPMIFTHPTSLIILTIPSRISYRAPLELPRNIHLIMLQILLFILLLIFSTFANAETKKIKIGVSTALSGPAATFGTDIKNAVFFANHEIANDKYDIVVEDDKCEGKEAVAVAHKLINIDKVSYVFGNCSATVLSTASIYQKAGTIVFAPLATSPNISTAADNIFRTAPNDTINAEILFHYISERHSKLGILTEQSDYSVDLLDAFLNYSRSANFSTFTQPYLSADNDFKSLILKLKQQKVDSLFINSNTEASFAVILKQLKESNYNIPIYGSYNPGSSSFLNLAKGNAEGIIFSDFPSIKDRLNKSDSIILEKYINKHGKPNAWDLVIYTTLEAFKVMHLAIESGKDPKEFLYNNEFSGVFGKYKFDKNGDIEGLRQVIKKIENGQVVTLKQVTF